MKTIVGPYDEILRKAQDYIDSFPTGSTVAIAYNEDTAKLHFDGMKTVQIMECGNLISDKFNFDVTVEQYNEEVIDLAVVGLGYKAQIGFNEIATPYSSVRHSQKLTESTKEDYSVFGSVPDVGITLGISDIVKAKNIMVFVLGNKRSEAVYNMLYARDDSTVPAAFLQLPLNVIVFADEEAGSKL